MQKFIRYLVQGEAEEVLQLGAGDEDGNAVSEADHHRAGNELDGGTHSGKAQQHQDDARHQRTHVQAIQPVRGDNTGHHNDEGPGGSANLGARAAEGRNEETREDGAVEARFRRDAGGNGEGEREWKRNQPNRDAGCEVAHKRRDVVRGKNLKRLRQRVFKRTQFRQHGHGRRMAGTWPGDAVTLSPN